MGPGETEGRTTDETVSVAAPGRSFSLALTIPDEVSAVKPQDGEVKGLGRLDDEREMAGTGLLINTLLSGVAGLMPYMSTSMGLPSDTEMDGDLSGVIGVDGPPRFLQTGDELKSVGLWLT